MKNFFATTAIFGLVATSAFGVSSTLKANAFVPSSNNIATVMTTTTVPEPPVVEERQTYSPAIEQIAWDSYYCEWDAYGNWYCIYG